MHMSQMNEMSMAIGLQYEPVTRSVLGPETLPHTPHKHAKKLLACILTSLTIHDKPVVAYHFNGSSVRGSELWRLLHAIA